MPTCEEVEALVINSVQLLAEDFDLAVLKQASVASSFVW